MPALTAEGFGYTFFKKRNGRRDMTEILVYIGAVIVVLAVCILAMSVGVIFRNRGFTSCGCARIRFRGEDIRCPACPDPDEDSSNKADSESARRNDGKSG